MQFDDWIATNSLTRAVVARRLRLPRRRIDALCSKSFTRVSEAVIVRIWLLTDGQVSANDLILPAPA